MDQRLLHAMLLAAHQLITEEREDT